MLLKACKPDNSESQDSLKLSFTKIQGLHSNFVDCESFLESNYLEIFAVRETNLDNSIDSDNFSMRGYSLLSERILVFIRIVSQFMSRKDVLLHRTYLQKTW